LRNRTGENGAIFQTIPNAANVGTDLVDFIFRAPDGAGTVQRNIRFEARAGFAKTGDPSFHIGGFNGTIPDPDNPTLSIGDNYSAFRKPLRIGSYSQPTAWLNLAPGSIAANTAPLKFTSGALLTNPEVGAIEFLNDKYYGTITTGTARKTFAFLESPVFTTPDIGAASGSSLTVSGSLTSSGSAGVGYSAGAGGTITQLTSKSTAVTINKISGQIIMDNANLNNNTNVTFQVNNTTVSATDVPVVAISGGTSVNYLISVLEVGSGFFKVTIRNVSGSTQNDALVINYAIIKAVNN
jgi:hypothetical protein